MANQEFNPKQLTTYGRLSFPTFTTKEAFELSKKGKYPVTDEAEATPSFNLVLTQTQHDAVLKHFLDHFLPYCVQQNSKGEKKDSLEQAEVTMLTEGLQGDLGKQVCNTPLRAVHPKTLELVPDAVSTLRVLGSSKGVNIDQRAIVQSAQELAVPDPDQLIFPVVKPIGQTIHQLYPGCYAAATLNLYSYHNGKLPGFSASASTIVFRMDADRFGGSVAVDEDAIFMD